MAGVDGGRTHRGPQRDPPPVLKTGEPTGTQPLPTAKDTAGRIIWQVNKVKISLSWDNSRWNPKTTDMDEIAQDNRSQQHKNPKGHDGIVIPMEDRLLCPGARA